MTTKKTENPFAGLESGVSGAILGVGRGAAYDADTRIGQKVRDALRVEIAGITIVLTEPRADKK